MLMFSRIRASEYSRVISQLNVRNSMKISIVFNSGSLLKLHLLFRVVLAPEKCICDSEVCHNVSVWGLMNFPHEELSQTASVVLVFQVAAMIDSVISSSS